MYRSTVVMSYDYASTLDLRERGETEFQFWQKYYRQDHMSQCINFPVSQSSVCEHEYKHNTPYS